ncbi:MAG TPA: cytochrome P450 [Chloroflexia bacterium]|nr:cytochrome P450 [Chloroflexia bacterium]
MTAPSPSPAVTFNPFVPPQLDDPYPVLAALREHSPVFFSDLLGAWVVTRYDDLSEVLRDPTRFSSQAVAAVPPNLPAEVQAILADGYHNPPLVNSDPPEHGRWRAVYNKLFAPPRMAALAPRIRALTEALVDGFIAEGRVELMRAFAYPLPMRVLLDMMGLPVSDMERIKAWCDTWGMLMFAPLPPDQQQRCAQAARDYQRYITEVVAERRARPGEDFISAFVQAPMAGERPADSEYAALVAGTLFAGNESTTCLIGSAVHCLLKQPAHWEMLRAQPTLIPKAVEEILRLDPPFMGFIRIATTTSEIGGVVIPAGARVLALFSAGNHDPAQFPAPEQCQFERATANQHLAFGKGIHFCSGAPLARLEARIALEVLTTRLPQPRLADQAVPYIPGLLRGPMQLVVEWAAPPTPEHLR